MPVREFLNPTDFSQPDEAMDLYSNSVRRAMQFDTFNDQTIFEAIILSAPFFLVDAQITDEEALPNVRAEGEGRLTKFAFKARILGNPSPHDYLPDPCKMNGDSSDEQRAQIRVVNLHTTFISSDDYTRSDISLPNVGDKVKVELEKNVHSYNLQFGKFISIINNNVGAPLTEDEACTSAQVAFGGGAATGAYGAAYPEPVLSETTFALQESDFLGDGYRLGTSSGADWGQRTSPSRGGMSWHSGVDVQNMPTGTPAYAICDGVIEHVHKGCPVEDPCRETGFRGCCGSGYGNHVKLKCLAHADSIAVYAHLVSVTKGLEQGTNVILGMQIGAVGDTGSSLGAHIHFEYKVFGSNAILSPNGSGRPPKDSDNNYIEWTAAEIATAEARGTPAHTGDDESFAWPAAGSHVRGRDRPNRWIQGYRIKQLKARVSGEHRAWYERCRSFLAGKQTKAEINNVIRFGTVPESPGLPQCFGPTG